MKAGGDTESWAPSPAYPCAYSTRSPFQLSGTSICHPAPWLLMPQMRFVVVPASALKGSVAGSTKNRVVSTWVSARALFAADSVAASTAIAMVMGRSRRLICPSALRSIGGSGLDRTRVIGERVHPLVVRRPDVRLDVLAELDRVLGGDVSVERFLV